VKVKTPFDAALVNTIQPVKLLEIDRDGIVKIELL
jgi:threonylcarbamoyladenosine tRNA methylthiotransferase MtaB